MAFLAERKPFLEPNVCAKWLDLIDQFFWPSVFARVLAEKCTANFNRIVNDCVSISTAAVVLLRNVTYVHRRAGLATGEAGRWGLRGILSYR
jgi:hypothetical protein